MYKFLVAKTIYFSFFYLQYYMVKNINPAALKNIEKMESFYL